MTISFKCLLPTTSLVGHGGKGKYHGNKGLPVIVVVFLLEVLTVRVIPLQSVPHIL